MKYLYNIIFILLVTIITFSTANQVIFADTTATATATIHSFGGNYVQITLTNGGSGYTIEPAVTITGVSGSGCTPTATASINGGVVTAITMASTGNSNCTGTPSVTIAPPGV